MKLGSKIKKLRTYANLSQEKFAEKFDVSRQAIQKWETGAAVPDLENVIKIAKFFNITVDSLLLDSSDRAAEEMYKERIIEPSFETRHLWEIYSEQLEIEYQQSVDEGINITEYRELFKDIQKMPKGKYKEQMADTLFNIILNSKKSDGYRYFEPSGLEAINAEAKRDFPVAELPETAVLKEKTEGAWYGRICGCLLGKPIEGIKTDELIPILKESGNYPMKRYILSSDITEEMLNKYQFRLKDRCYADITEYAPVDDDTNYTVLYQLVIDKYGRDFTPYDVAEAWVAYQSRNAYCTAERVAFCNFIKGYVPPESAIYKNPFREWIGAQIRGDYFGYINPGNPEAAAEMAWRDASVSHIKNGIYGEMFVAAMLACATVSDDICEIINGGIAQIPVSSRLYEEIKRILNDFHNGVSEKQCFNGIHERYNEHSEHHWCHTISNAAIVTAALLYGKNDFGKSICLAVQAGFDTDCNGATVGSVMGMKNGVNSISDAWKKPINGKLKTSIFGMETVNIADLANITMRHIKLKYSK